MGTRTTWLPRSSSSFRKAFMRWIRKFNYREGSSISRGIVSVGSNLGSRGSIHEQNRDQSPQQQKRDG